jgi:hypothetical protein
MRIAGGHELDHANVCFSLCRLLALCDVTEGRDSVVSLVQGNGAHLKLEKAGRRRVFSLHQQVGGALPSVTFGKHFDDAHTGALEF